MNSFEEKIVIITGGGKSLLSNGKCGSIGYGIATAFAKEKANLVLTGRNIQKLLDAKFDLESKYRIKVLAIPADIAPSQDNEKLVNSVVRQAINAFGRIDVLVNNAQSSVAGISLAQHTTSDFDLALYSGLFATFYYMRACYPYLARVRGSVINFASGAGLFGSQGQSSYAAAKEGIRGLSRVAATEWAKDHINVNVLCPLAWTVQLEQFKKTHPEAYNLNVKVPPMGHFADPETEIGRICLQLASPDFKYMTGETITVEGGLGLRP
ncbi:MAG: SDR family oxidoreductase [Spirochaetaceae bacterium]|nr:SDR family oxidoreductase [Spirochaetaceae bacterium]